jgi:hypothetical protein
MIIPENNREQKHNFTTESITGKLLLEEINNLPEVDKIRFYPLDYTEIGEDYEEIKKPGGFSLFST